MQNEEYRTAARSMYVSAPVESVGHPWNCTNTKE